MALNVLQEPEKSKCVNCQKPSHWAGYVVQSRKVWREDLKKYGIPDQGSGLEADDAKVKEDLQAQSNEMSNLSPNFWINWSLRICSSKQR